MKAGGGGDGGGRGKSKGNKKGRGKANPALEEALERWEPIIGIEIHAQLSSSTKVNRDSPSALPPDKSVVADCATHYPQQDNSGAYRKLTSTTTYLCLSAHGGAPNLMPASVSSRTYRMQSMNQSIHTLPT